VSSALPSILKTSNAQTSSWIVGKPETIHKRGLDLWEAPKLLSRMFVKVYSPCPNSELLIALHSPSAILEIGLCRYPAERSGDSDPVLS